MKLKSDTQQDVALLAVEGRFDAFASDDVAGELSKFIEDQQSNIWVDLSNTDFIDSSALAVLVRFMKTARSAGGDLTIWKPSDAVRVVLELTSLNLAFSISTNTASPIVEQRSEK